MTIATPLKWLTKTNKQKPTRDGEQPEYQTLEYTLVKLFGKEFESLL